MLKALDLKNLTVFTKANLKFGPHLNLIIGENGTGKSHLLKLPYCIIAASWEESRKAGATTPTKSGLQTRLSEKLMGVLRPEGLGRLAHRQVGVSSCKVQCRLGPASLDIDFSFSTKSRSDVQIEKVPTEWASKAPVFFPTRELLTIYPGFVSVYENHYLEFEETWRDTCVLLGAPAIRGPREARITELLEPLEEAMRGKIVLDKVGRFYLQSSGGEGQLEMPLVAEGLRKLAMVARLIATGSLLDSGYLFWDEPETNLNPKLIRSAAGTILHLCKNGIQVFVATHSLYLMRELDILLKSAEFKDLEGRFIGLARTDKEVVVQQGDSIDDIGGIAALDEELSQSDRYLKTGAAEDAVAN